MNYDPDYDPGPDYKADRAAAVAWARSVVADPTTVYLDTETTGLGTGAEVIELAILDSAGTPLFNSRFCPTVTIEAGATAAHGLTAADLAACPRFDDCWSAIAPLLTGRRVVIYNRAFDVRLLNQTILRYGLSLTPTQRWECAMEQYAAWVGDWSDSHGNYRWQPLERAASSTDSRPDHTALGDARACRAVVARLAQEKTEE